jgi:hypothetical protein
MVFTPAVDEPLREAMQVLREGLESADRLWVPIRPDRRHMHRGADINRRRGRVDGRQAPLTTGPLRSSHGMCPPAVDRGARLCELINFLTGIAAWRHHSQVRNSLWATFFYGV